MSVQVKVGQLWVYTTSRSEIPVRVTRMVSDNLPPCALVKNVKDPDFYLLCPIKWLEESAYWRLIEDVP